MLPFRAVENGTPFVRSDPNGLSQVIDGHGRVLAQGPLYRSAIVSATVVLGTGRGTFFTRTGDWLAWLCVAGFVAIGALPSVRGTPRPAIR
jgi:apolipoprotein N-acyltransferase